jgi:hypothetical protein
LPEEFGRVLKDSGSCRKMSGTWWRNAAVCRNHSGTARKAAGWHLTPFVDGFIFCGMDNITSSRWLPVVLLTSRTFS